MKANLIAFKDKAGHDGPQSPREHQVLNSDDWIGVGQTPLHRARRLDVDEVLARSLPKTCVNRDGAPRSKSLVK
jgi:hypothetical protein